MSKQRSELKKELEKIDRRLKTTTGVSTRRKLLQRKIEIKKELKKKKR